VSLQASAFRLPGHVRIRARKPEAICLCPGLLPRGGVRPRAIGSGVFGIVGEVSGYPNEWASYEPSCDREHSICAVNHTNHVRAALAGVKGRTPLIDGGTARGRFFAQVLLGPEWSDVLPRQGVVALGFCLRLRLAPVDNRIRA
jgi:hypothetical protein